MAIGLGYHRRFCFHRDPRRAGRLRAPGPGGVAAGDALIVYVVSGILTGVVRESYLAGQRTAVVGQRPAMAGESVREDVDWYTDRLRQQRNDRDQAADQQ